MPLERINMNTINIHSNLYDYTVEFITDFSHTLSSFTESVAYVIDQNVYQLYKNRFGNIDLGKTYFMDAVEHKKNMDTVMDIIAFWKRIGVKKNWKIICFGGGISQDVTTIASNLYLRNIDWYFFPTTLLSMCDSCIGGKCGINLGEYKNQIGVFYPPKKIYIDVRFLDTLSEGDYVNGWGELLKFSLTNGTDFYKQLCSEPQYIPCLNIAEYIYKGLMVKKSVIEEDEFESDLRRVLNYGHTFGHALEAYTHNEIPHGKAVIWGIDVVNYIALKEKLISKEYYDNIKSLIKQAFIKTEIKIDEPHRLFEITKSDKKVKGNILNFALLNAPSHLIVYPIELNAALEDTFIDYLKETHEYYSN